MNNWTPLKRFWNLLASYKPEIRMIYAYAVLNGIVNLSLPLGIQAIINYLQTGEVSSSWIVLVVFVLIGIALSGVFQVQQLRIVEHIQQEIFAKSAFEFSFRLPKIKLLKLDKVHAPELANRFFDTLTIQKGLPKILIDFSLAGFQVIFGLVLLSIYSPFFIILGLVLLLLVYLIFQLTGPKGLVTSLEESKHKYKIAHWIEEVARVNRSFKISPNTQLHLNKTDEETSSYINARRKHFGVLLLQFEFFIVFKVLVAASLLLLGGFLVFQNQMNIGQFVAAEIIIILVINSIEKLLKVIETIYDVLTALEKIGYISDLELDSDTATGIFSKADKGVEIKLVDLEFQFPGEKSPIFSKINAEIPSGQKVIVNAPPGSGKSILLKLLAGLYSPTDGELILNNRPVSAYAKVELYRKIAINLSSNQLFEGSIRDNICIGQNISEDLLNEVINRLFLSDYLAHQPFGIETKIDSGGRRLPRSIIQKIQLARVLVQDPCVILFEDPLYSIKDEEKIAIIDYIMEAFSNSTIITISDFYYWKERSTTTLLIG